MIADSVNHPAAFNYPASTIKAKWTQPVRVKWINERIGKSRS
jgi:spore coat protein A, manganese oxidase